MSRKGNCDDNATMETFFGALKTELIRHRRYRTRLKAMQDIRKYIEIFHYRQRRQAKLGYFFPVAYEKEFYKLQKAA